MTDICHLINILYTYLVYSIQLFRNGSLYPRGMSSLLLIFDWNTFQFNEYVMILI